MQSIFLSLPYGLRIGLAAGALVVALWVIVSPDSAGRAACEQRHSPATCTHVLRG